MGIENHQESLFSLLERIDASAQQNDVYRAIGRYIVRFSILISTMQGFVYDCIAAPPGRSQEEELLTLVVGGLPAQPVADSFFAMCRHLTEFDTKAKQGIEATLREQVNQEIRRRNRVAHGQWGVPGTVDAPGERIAPTFLRVSPGSVKAPVDYRDITAAEVDGYSIEMDALGCTIFDFGATCCGQWRYLWTDEDETPPPLPSLLEMFGVVDGRVVHRRIGNHPLARFYSE